MPRTDNKILAMLGFSVTGDMGPYTLYRSHRGKLIFYPRAPALNPPTPLQSVMRQRFKVAAQMWQMMPPSQHQAWERATIKTRLKLTGYDLWVYWWTTRDLPFLKHVIRYSKEKLELRI
jgi:hypothetical protein